MRSSELGYDAWVDHKSPTFAADMKAALPNGVDGLFENVGGEPFQQTMRRINDFARVAICGLIASYEGAATALPDMRLFLVRRFKMEGFIVSDHLDLWPQAHRGTRRPRRRRQAEVAGNDPRGHRTHPAGAGRSAARRQFRQDAGETGLSAAQQFRRD